MMMNWRAYQISSLICATAQHFCFRNTGGAAATETRRRRAPAGVAQGVWARRVRPVVAIRLPTPASHHALPPGTVPSTVPAVLEHGIEGARPPTPVGCQYSIHLVFVVQTT
jgi:hypothetical protein